MRSSSRPTGQRITLRAREAENFLTGKEITEENMAEAGNIAVSEAKPIDDFRASKAYRRELIAVLTRRCLAGATPSDSPSRSTP